MSEERKEVKYTKYQQGDVVMYKIENDKDFVHYSNELSNKSKEHYKVVKYKGQTDSRAILAFGEVTGHTHRVEMSEMVENAGITLHMDYQDEAGIKVPKAFEVEGAPVQLDHEEHNTLTLPEGKYVVKIVREFNHITRRAQYVAD